MVDISLCVCVCNYVHKERSSSLQWEIMAQVVEEQSCTPVNVASCCPFPFSMIKHIWNVVCEYIFVYIVLEKKK